MPPPEKETPVVELDMSFYDELHRQITSGGTVTVTDVQHETLLELYPGLDMANVTIVPTPEAGVEIGE